MNYQGNTGTVLSATSTVAGVAVLPNTGANDVLRFTAIAAIVTGIVAISLQVAVALYRRSR